MTEAPEKSEEKFDSKLVKLTKKILPGCVVEYTVDASPSIVSDGKKMAVKSVAKEVSLPGFRKGRAPDSMVLSKFKDAVDQQWDKSIADIAFKECQTLAKTPVTGNDARINFNLKSKSEEKGASLLFTFESEPILPKIECEKIELVNVEPKQITQKELDVTVSNIRSYFAQWKNISNKEVQEGDFCLIDLDLIEKEPHEKVFNKARFEFKKGKMAEWMFEALIGMRAGDKKETVSQPDENANEDDKKQFQQKKVCIQLHTIQQPTYPEVDDNLAQKMGAKNLDDMLEKLKTLLNKQSQDEARKQLREQVENELLEKYRFDIPKTMLSKEIEFRIKQLVNDPNFKSSAPKMTEEEKKTILKQIETQAERAIRLFYLSRTIVNEHKIKINPSEVNKQINTPLDAMFSGPSNMYSANQKSQEQKSIATSKLLLEKSEDFIIEKAKFVQSKSKPKKKTDTKAKKASEKTVSKVSKKPRASGSKEKNSDGSTEKTTVDKDKVKDTKSNEPSTNTPKKAAKKKISSTTKKKA